MENISKEFKKLDEAHTLHKEIITDCQKQKFTYLADWIRFQARTFHGENKKRDRIKFKTYKRGTIIYANFGTSIGSELSGNHFAIVLTKYDNPYNAKLTVIPLTSKDKSYNIPLEKYVITKIFQDIFIEVFKFCYSIIGKDEFQKRMYSSVESNGKDFLDYAFSNIDESTIEPISDISEETQKKIVARWEDFQKNFSFYEKYINNSFAMIDNITTISKFRINKPLNDEDPIGKAIVPDYIIKKLDKAILEKFTDLI